MSSTSSGEFGIFLWSSKALGAFVWVGVTMGSDLYSAGMTMARPFDPVAYTMQVGWELVGDFQMAGFATTPSLVGSAREVSVREKLMKLLPKGVGIGSGCVIDSFGNCSRQMDVVLFENDFCPEFVINNDPGSTYYPCEGVIAVGEVKTAIDSRELGNIFEKVKSVKALRRFARSSPSGIGFIPAPAGSALPLPAGWS